MLKALIKLVEYQVFIALLIVLFVVASPLLPMQTFVATYVVSSGSMEPAIKTGSVVLVQPQPVYKVGDVITFTSPDDSKKEIVHRIVEIQEAGESKLYVTKGDNNEAKDSWFLAPSLIKGKSVGQIPYLGYVINYFKTVKGFAIGIGIPALILVILEIKRIKEGIDEEVKRRTEKEIIRLKNTEVIILGLLLTGLLCVVKPVYAYFSSTVTLTGMTLEVADIYEINPGDVVINEIMRTGTLGLPDALWLELRNTTNHEIDISQWIIENATEKNGKRRPDIHIPGNSRLAANGYYLISKRNANSANSSLTYKVDQQQGDLGFNGYEESEKIRLTTKDKVLIDEVHIFSWSFAENLRSLERDEDGNWHEYYGEGNGTPGAENSNENTLRVVSTETNVEVEIAKNLKSATIILSGNGLELFTRAKYELNYVTNTIPQKIVGEFELEKEHKVDLGTCTSNGVCVYPAEVLNPTIEVILNGLMLERRITGIGL